MNVRILCDSRFGNTRMLADTMQTALADMHTVEIRAAGDGIGDPAGLDLLLVGGPTHAHGASQALKEALKTLSSGSLSGVTAATFDTRFRMSRLLTGSAATATSKLLEHAGANLASMPESFFVSRQSPPVLEPGELVRAAAWARSLAGR
jgi:flavodoxin